VYKCKKIQFLNINIHFAANGGYPGVVESIVNKNAAINVINQKVEYLINHNAEINTIKKFWQTPLRIN